MQEMVRNVEVALPVKQYLVNIARATRGHPQVAQGISPRGTVLLQRASQCWAALEGRSFMTPDDAKEVAPLVLRHRVDPRSDVMNTASVAKLGPVLANRSRISLCASRDSGSEVNPASVVRASPSIVKISPIATMTVTIQAATVVHGLRGSSGAYASYGPRRKHATPPYV